MTIKLKVKNTTKLGDFIGIPMNTEMDINYKEEDKAIIDKYIDPLLADLKNRYGFDKMNCLEENLRIDCYLAVLRKFRLMYPQAHFEVITRTAKSVLSPSKSLLNSAKLGHWDFQTQYKTAFLGEIDRSEKAQKRMLYLRSLAQDRIVFLVCYEKDHRICHRSLIKDQIIALKKL